MFSFPLSLPRSVVATGIIDMPIEFYVKSWRKDLLTPTANRGASSCIPTSQHILRSNQQLTQICMKIPSTALSHMYVQTKGPF